MRFTLNHGGKNGGTVDIEPNEIPADEIRNFVEAGFAKWKHMFGKENIYHMPLKDYEKIYGNDKRARTQFYRSIGHEGLHSFFKNRNHEGILKRKNDDVNGIPIDIPKELTQFNVDHKSEELLGKRLFDMFKELKKINSDEAITKAERINGSQILNGVYKKGRKAALLNGEGIV